MRRPNHIVAVVSNLVLYPAVAVVLFVFIWEGTVRILNVPDYILPSPHSILTYAFANLDFLSTHMLVTLYEVSIGFALSVLIGVIFAIILVASPPIEKALLPLLVMSQTFPKIAIAPLFIIWFGFGLAPKVIISLLISFFPIVISTVAGLKSVENDAIDLLRSMGATTAQLFYRVRIPTSLPFMFNGLKVAVTLAVIGAIVGEFVGSDGGLGYLLLVANGNLDTKLLFSVLLLLMILGVFLFVLVISIERFSLPWYFAARKKVGVSIVA